MEQKDDDLIIEGVKRIKQLIQDKNLKQIDLVNALDISKKTVTQWLQSSTTPSAQNLMELARLLSVAERWISEDKSLPKNAVGKSSVKASAAKLTERTKDPDLSQFTVDQLLAEIKGRYADLNLKAEISVHVEPIMGGFVTKD